MQYGAHREYITCIGDGCDRKPWTPKATWPPAQLARNATAQHADDNHFSHQYRINPAAVNYLESLAYRIEPGVASLVNMPAPVYAKQNHARQSPFIPAPRDGVGTDDSET